MNVYVAFLRGINVGGHRKILMEDLKKLFTELGYNAVRTYIQSGNVVFVSRKRPNTLEKEVESAIMNKYGFKVSVMVRTANEINDLFNVNPFLSKNADIDKLYIVFLSEDPSEENMKKLLNIDFQHDRFQIIDKQVFVCYREKLSKSKLTNKVIETKLKVRATTRNWKTIGKLDEIIKKSI